MLFTLLLFITNSWGQVGTTTDALGGAAIANSHALDSAWTNPAGLAAAVGASAGIQYFNGDVAKDTELTQWGATITDASSGSFPGSVGYKRRRYEVGGNKVREQQFRFAAAFPFTSTFVMGLAAYRVMTDPWVGPKTDQDNGDLSLLWLPLPELKIGVITRGVLGAKDNIYGFSRVVPSGGVGGRYNFSNSLGLLADVNYGYEDVGTGKRWDTRVGLEFLNSQGIALRMGYNNDDWHGERRISAGFGWDGPKLRVGYSYQKENRKDLGDSHTVDIWMAF